MIILNLVKSIKKFFNIGNDRDPKHTTGGGTDNKPDSKTRDYTRHMIKKYGKTLRKLSYE